MVDDQFETYTVELLKKLKSNHESWVSTALSEEKKERKPIVIRRIKENIPSHLTRLTTGQQLMSVLSDACSFGFEHDEPRNEEEMEMISAFLQEAQDWGDLSAEFEAGQKVQAAFRMSEMIKEIEKAGFWVFGGREIQRLEGGIEGPSTWPVSLLRITRSSNPEIVKITLKPDVRSNETKA